MAEAKPTSKAPQIRLAPNEILMNVVQILNGRVDNLAKDIDIDTTCGKALEHVQSLLSNDDRPLVMMRMRTREERRRLKELASETWGPSGPLTILNAIPASELPMPKRATSGERKILRESLHLEAAMSKPYNMTHALVEDQNLATISGQIKISAIAAWGLDPTMDIRHDHCMWDTGAQYCSISEDLITKVDPTFLDLEIHKDYRTPYFTGVQVDGMFSLSNTTIEISTVFRVLPTSAIPNGRSGIILGQHGFIDRMTVETIPRSILVKRGEELDDNRWGAIHIKAFLNLHGDLQEFKITDPNGESAK